MFWVKIEDFEAICFNLACDLFTYNQPIPPFTTRFPGVLESCLATPIQQTQEGDIYETLEDKLSILFYIMIKNHPFLNGNKRMAVAILLVTLYGNRKWITAEPEDLYKIAVDISKSEFSKKDEYVEKINKFLKRHMIEAPLLERLFDQFSS